MKGARRKIEIHPLAPVRVAPPPRGVLQYYLAAVASVPVSKTGRTIEPEKLRDVFRTPAQARQTAHYWTKHNLAVRLRHGDYALVDPSVAIRTWAIPPYYAKLLALHDVLKAREIPHAFACLTAALHSDYVPEDPILVMRHDEEERTSKIEAIRFDFPRSHVTQTTLHSIGEEYIVPALAPAETAIVFASLGVPRELKVARDLAQGHEACKDFALFLNHYGLRTNKKIFKSRDPNITLTPSWAKRRRSYADALVTSGDRLTRPP